MFIDPLGLFRFGKKYFIPGGVGTGPLLNMANLELAHEHGFFTDDISGDDIGFFPEGVQRNVADIDDYELDSTYYRDDIMRQAIKNVNPGDYSLIGSMYQRQNNCQNYADSLKKEYYHIKNNY